MANIKKQIWVNERIRAREVRLIDAEGKQAGVVPFRDALQMAKDAGLDLIEVAPTAVPPVCRIMDFGKFKYEQAKREKEAQKKSKQSELRMIRVRPNIDEHDFHTKLKHAHDFLEDGDKVRIFVVFRSREGLTEVGIVEKAPSMEGRQMTLIVSPKVKVLPKPTPAPKPKPPTEAKPPAEAKAPEAKPPAQATVPEAKPPTEATAPE
jgi:translation initiation factor IF-3